MTADALRERLQDLGFPAAEGDERELARLMTREENALLARCNLAQLTDDLAAAAVDRAAGAFLEEKKGAGTLPGFPGDTAVKSVQAGDTSVTFSEAMTPENRLDALFAALRQSGEGLLPRYRRLRW